MIELKSQRKTRHFRPLSTTTVSTLCQTQLITSSSKRTPTRRITWPSWAGHVTHYRLPSAVVHGWTCIGVVVVAAPVSHSSSSRTRFTDSSRTNVDPVTYWYLPCLSQPQHTHYYHISCNRSHRLLLEQEECKCLCLWLLNGGWLSNNWDGQPNRRLNNPTARITRLVTFRTFIKQCRFLGLSVGSLR